MPRSEEYDEGFDDGYDKGCSDTEEQHEKKAAEKHEKYTVTMSKDLYTASVTDEPGVFETSAVSAYDALGRLVARLAPVRTHGRLVL